MSENFYQENHESGCFPIDSWYTNEKGVSTRKTPKEIVMEFKQYRRKGLSEMRPYQAGEDMSGISVSDADKTAGSPKEGDMIARNPKDHNDQWLVAKKYFEDNLEPV